MEDVAHCGYIFFSVSVDGKPVRSFTNGGVWTVTCETHTTKVDKAKLQDGSYSIFCAEITIAVI
ncbi:hypothetical protein [Lysinibacillus sp. FSL K6-3209]|uniref:hypothetical protein n=1 Tax=Lysinibacillus sp. FSL K6-3209 TaxID=2921497 RepID=UPI0030DCFFDC